MSETKKESYAEKAQRQHVEMLQRRASDREANPPKKPAAAALTAKKDAKGKSYKPHSHMGNSVYDLINKRRFK